MAKADIDRKLKQLYFPSAKEPVLIRVPKMNFLMIDGQGNPNKPGEFQDSIGALYGTAYTMKFTFEKGHPIRAARVQPLEGLFWTRGRRGLNFDAKGMLCWTLMLRQPPPVNRSAVKAAIQTLREKKDPPLLDRLRFEPFAEGWCVQVMHIGPYSAEKPTIARLHAFAHDNGCCLRGHHHEIYLGDPRRTKPEKLKTVIRQPVERKR